jgi:hypothetical protein
METVAKYESHLAYIHFTAEFQGQTSRPNFTAKSFSARHAVVRDPRLNIGDLWRRRRKWPQREGKEKCGTILTAI